MPSELDRLLGRLESFGVRLGLETTHRLLTSLGEPQKRLHTVLVAGTNGKGSTASLLAGMASTAGYRTGLYTSPHLEAVEERLRIDGEAIATDRFCEILERVVGAAETRMGYLPTYFEAVTAAACVWFAEESVDLAVLEVGLGGRLDATNGTEPVLSLITEIGLEHQSYLGPTLADIGREKAGVMRPGRPAVAWVERPEARRSIVRVAEEIGAELSWGPDVARVERVEYCPQRGRQVFALTTPAGEMSVDLPLLGEHQGKNLALAILGAEALFKLGWTQLDRQAMRTGAMRVRWPGRLEWVEPSGRTPWLLDVAHNPDGAATLMRALAEVPGCASLVFGALSDKDVGNVLPQLAQRASTVILTEPTSERALPVSVLVDLLPGQDPQVRRHPVAAVDAALAAADDFVVVCGSVYLVGEVRRELRRRFGVPAAATHGLLGPRWFDSPSQVESG